MAALLAPCPIGRGAFTSGKRSPCICSAAYRVPAQQATTVQHETITSLITVDRRHALAAAAAVLVGSASLAPQAGAVGLRAAKGTKAAGSGFLSPAARSQELAQKESQRKAELKEKYAKLRAEGAPPAPQG